MIGLLVLLAAASGMISYSLAVFSGVGVIGASLGATLGIVICLFALMGD